MNNSSFFEGEDFDVDVVTLDSLIERGYPLPDVIKIDVEGGADEVLAGGSCLFDRDDRPSIYIELHSDLELKAVSKHLISRGYLAESLSGMKIDNPLHNPQKVLWLYAS